VRQNGILLQSGAGCRV